MVKRVVVGAHYGSRGWLVQRLSAVIMALYVVLLILALYTHGPFDFWQWKGLFHKPWMRIATLVFLLSLFAHAWVGMRDILMDYVHSTWLRLSMETLVFVMLIAYTIWSIQILWSA